MMDVEMGRSTPSESAYTFEHQLWYGCLPQWENPANRKGALKLAEFIVNSVIVNSVTQGRPRFDLSDRELRWLDDYVGIANDNDLGGAYVSRRISLT